MHRSRKVLGFSGTSLEVSVECLSSLYSGHLVQSVSAQKRSLGSTDDGVKLRPDRYCVRRDSGGTEGNEGIGASSKWIVLRTLLPRFAMRA